MSPHEILASLFMALIVLSSAIAAFSKRNFHAVIAIFISTVGLSIQFVVFNAVFPALTMAAIFVGIVTAMVLYILLPASSYMPHIARGSKKYLLFYITASAFLYISIVILIQNSYTAPTDYMNDFSIKKLGLLLFSDYIVPMELSAFILLATIIGTAGIIRRNKRWEH